MAEQGPPIRERRARKEAHDAATPPDCPIGLDGRVAAVESHLGTQDRIMAERITAVDAQFAAVRDNLLMQDRHIAERADVVDTQFNTLSEGQHAMLEMIQVLPAISVEDARYLHTLATEWPRDKVDIRTEQMGRFETFMAAIAPLLPMVRTIVTERADVADKLKIDTAERRQQAQHFWGLAHSAVRWFLAASLTVLGGVPVGLSVYLFSSRQVSGTTLALVLFGTVAVAIGAYLFVAARLKAVGPLPTTTAIVGEGDAARPLGQGGGDPSPAIDGTDEPIATRGRA